MSYNGAVNASRNPRGRPERRPRERSRRTPSPERPRGVRSAHQVRGLAFPLEAVMTLDKIRATNRPDAGTITEWWIERRGPRDQTWHYVFQSLRDAITAHKRLQEAIAERPDCEHRIMASGVMANA